MRSVGTRARRLVALTLWLAAAAAPAQTLYEMQDGVQAPRVLRR